MYRKKVLLILFALFCCYWTGAQNGLDTMQLKDIKIAPKSKLISKLYNGAISSISRTPGDTITDDAMVIKSEQVYKKYEGKIVRDFKVKQLGFEKIVTDTSSRLIAWGTNFLNSLHVNSRDWVIINNVFIDKNRPLNPFEIADNERYLRTLEFIQDARIIVEPVKGTDSVDLVFVVRDLFSLTGGLDVRGVNYVKTTLADANLFGMGQRLEISSLYENRRSPNWGYEVLYRKNSIFGTFIDATVGYTVINPSISDGSEEEKAYFLRLERPLTSPYNRLAGGLLFSRNNTINVYGEPDSVFYAYGFNTYDGWIGYNLGSKWFLKNNKIRDRKFLALRYFNTHYDNIPNQVEGLHPVYNDKQALLASVTFFRQDYNKTSYIYGFGTTEDVPEGYNATVTAGWYHHLHLERPYLGLHVDRYKVYKKGDIVRYYMRSGVFPYKGEMQDASILVGAAAFGRVIKLKDMRVRPYVNASYTKLFNRTVYEPLALNNDFGIRDFDSEYIWGDERLSFQSETSFFLNYRILGFRFAPFVTSDLVFLSFRDRGLFNSEFYPAIGGGLRTRNENLVFGTIEVRMNYFPKAIQGQTPFKITFTSNLRFRYKSNYVSAPNFVQLNVMD